jgi:redox-sensitive bicupin YhaK (pirin superfamily)
VQVARGSIQVNREALSAGDAAKLTDVTRVTLSDGAAAEILLFDLP